MGMKELTANGQLVSFDSIISGKDKMPNLLKLIGLDPSSQGKAIDQMIQEQKQKLTE